MRIAILDPAAGISGDMTLGALLSLGLPISWLEELPHRLGVRDVGVAVRDVRRSGVTCKKVDFEIPEQPHGRHVGELVQLVERAPISEWVKTRAVRAFPLLGGAEGQMHGGAGERDPKHYPNALRILVAEAASEASRVVLLATDVDDMSPEYVDPLRQALVSAGALDVQTWPVQMKKGRQGFRVEVMAPEALAETVTAELFRHSTTAGVRRWVAERATLPRHELTVRLDGVAVRVEGLDGGSVRVQPEYDDVLAAAQALGRPPREVARAVERDAETMIAKTKE